MACASIHGNTKKAAELLAEKLKATGVKVAFTDLCRDDMAEAVEGCVQIRQACALRMHI